MPSVLANRRGDGAIVAGEHHDANAESFEIAEGIGRRRL